MRRKEPPLVAVPLTRGESITLPDGREILARPGSFRIVRGNELLAVVPADRLAQEYDDISEGGLRLTADECRALEITLGLGATASPESLGVAIGRLAKIDIGEITIPFTPGQLSELKFRATKRGRTVQQELLAVLDRIKDELFWRAG